MRQTVSGVAAVCLGVVCASGVTRAELASDNALNVSWGDQIVVGRGIARLDTPEHIREALGRWQTMGRVTTVYWRISSWLIQNYHVHRKKGYEWYYEPLREIEARCDPRAEALSVCQALGLKLYAYLTVYDEGCPPTVLYGDNSPFPWQSRFTIEHPEFLVCDRSGEKRHWGVMEYWYPEVRRYKVEQVSRFLDAYGYDGIYICTRSHSPPAATADTYGFNPPVVEEFKRRHGVDILTQEFDIQAWRDLRGEGLTQVLRELRVELRRRGKTLAVGIPRTESTGPPYGNMTLHWRTWVEQDLVDELVLGVRSGNFHYPSQKGRDRERGYLASGDDGFGLQPLLTDVRGKYGPVCQRHGVKLRAIGSKPYALPPLSGHMIGAMAFGNQIVQVLVAPHPSLDLQSAEATVDFWFYAETTDDYPRLLSKYDHTLGEEGRGWEVMIGEQNRIVFRFAYPGVDRHVCSAEPVEANKWTHVACGFAGPDRKAVIYLNGRLSVNGNVTGDLPRIVPVPLRLGCYGGGGRPLDGQLASVRVWDRAATFNAKGAVTTGAGKAPVFRLDFVRRDAAGAKGTVVVPVGVDVAVLGDLSGQLTSGPVTGTWAVRLGR